MTTGNWNLGSVQEHVSKVIGATNVPSTISGTNMNSVIDQQINEVEQYTTITIDSDVIPEKYQPAIISFTMASVLSSIDMQEKGIDNISLGDLKVSQGGGSNAKLANQLREDAIRRLKELSRTVRFKQVIG